MRGWRARREMEAEMSEKWRGQAIPQQLAGRQRQRTKGEKWRRSSTEAYGGPRGPEGGRWAEMITTLRHTGWYAGDISSRVAFKRACQHLRSTIFPHYVLILPLLFIFLKLRLVDKDTEQAHIATHSAAATANWGQKLWRIVLWCINSTSWREKSVNEKIKCC